MTRISGLVAVLLAACGSSDKGTAAGGGGTSSIVITNGSVAGALTNATSATVSGPCMRGTISGQFSGAEVRVTSIAEYCQAVQQGRDPANATVLQLALVRFTVGATGPRLAIVPGTYPLWVGTPLPTPDAQGVYWYMQGKATRTGGAVSGEPGCEITVERDILSGTVTVTDASSGQIAGTIDATLVDGGRVQGAFTAPSCTLSLSLTPTCDIAGEPTTSCE